MKKKKIMVAGHLCVDITPVFPEGKSGRLPDYLIPGKLIHMDPAAVHTGGVVANTGLALKKLGADVRLVGKVGKDAFGDLVRGIMRNHDADQDVLVDEKVSTSYTIVLAPPGVDRIFLHDPGANDSFCADDIPDQMLSDVALFHFGYPPIMRRMYLEDGAELVRLLQRVREKGIAVSLDLAAVDEESEAAKTDWKKLLERTLPLVDFFVPSAEELCYMVDRSRYDAWMNRADGRDVTEILRVEEDIRPLARQVMELGAKVLLIKCGAKGMYYCTGTEERLGRIPEAAGIDPALWSNREGFQKSFVPERVRSGTGAGDSSIAAFLYAVRRGYPVEKCVRLAAAEGASCVEEFDALSGVKTLEELEEKTERGWKQRD